MQILQTDIQTDYQTFFRAFGYADTDTVYIRTFNDRDRTKPGKNYGVMLYKLGELLPVLQKKNEQNNGVFFVVNGGGQSDKAVKTARALFIDFDDFPFEEQLEKLKRFQLEPSIITKTRKSLHCYWLLSVPEKNLNAWRALQLAAIDYFGSDPNIKNPSRVMRLYGFNHCKQEPCAVKLIKFNPEIKYTLQQLQDALPQPRAAAPPLVKNTGLHTIGEGGRTNYLVSKVGSMRTRNLSAAAIRAAIRAENEAVCSPPLTEQELEREVFPAITRAGSWEERQEPAGPVTLKKLSDIEERAANWLIPGYIPKGAITLLVGDGGSGKTALWCNIVAAITRGEASILEADCPFPVEDEPGMCIYFSAEDSTAEVLKPRLKAAGADENMVYLIESTNDAFQKMHFNSRVLHDIVAEYRPALIVFDPLQSFIPPDVNMSSRNAMRQSMTPLLALGEKYKTTFLIICHTNKKQGVSGRGRVSDSSDIWDIARSVLIVGETGDDGIRYLSHEKSNLGPEQGTILYSIQNGGRAVYEGKTSKKDRDFVQGLLHAMRSAPARDEAKDIILKELQEGERPVIELDDAVKACGVSVQTLKRAKTDLKVSGKIAYRVEGYGKHKTFFVRAVKQ